MSVVDPLFNDRDCEVSRIFELQRLVGDWLDTFGIDVQRLTKDCTILYEYRHIPTGYFFFKPDSFVGDDQFYAQLQKFDWYYSKNRLEFQNVMGRLSPTSFLLEVGCGEGAFLEQCREKGIRGVGIELNSKAADIAKAKGLSVSATAIESFAREFTNSFDYVCSFQVLEHISNPKPFLESCLKVLKPGGKLILCVPNADSVLCQSYSILDMPPHHQIRLNRRAFESFGKVLPVSVDWIEELPLEAQHVEWYNFLEARQRFFMRQLMKLRIGRKIIRDYTLKFRAKKIIGHSIVACFTKS